MQMHALHRDQMLSFAVTHEPQRYLYPCHVFRLDLTQVTIMKKRNRQRGSPKIKSVQNKSFACANVADMRFQSSGGKTVE
jgi:hypothetical protein